MMMMMVVMMMYTLMMMSMMTDIMYSTWMEKQEPLTIGAKQDNNTRYVSRLYHHHHHDRTGDASSPPSANGAAPKLIRNRTLRMNSFSNAPSFVEDDDEEPECMSRYDDDDV